MPAVGAMPFCKVKRLFMFLAEACNHAWVKKLELAKVNFEHYTALWKLRKS